MTVIRGLRKLKSPIAGSVLTIGVFDGVHMGHKTIIGRVAGRVRELNCDSHLRHRLKSAVLTFEPHPLKVLRPGYAVPSLISLEHRTRLIRELGVDILAVAKFTRSLSKISPRNFVKDILLGKFKAREVYVGENFRFGKGARAGISELKDLSREFGFKVKAVRPLEMGGHIVSSSRIRKLILEGNLDEAAQLLGRSVSVLGTVVSGSKLGRALGYPTANINPHHEVIPPTGVYAVTVNIDNGRFKGILNIGLRPTFYSPRDKEPTIEVHIFDFDDRIYGKEMEIFFIKKLRDEIRFKDENALISQIRQDTKLARRV